MKNKTLIILLIISIISIWLVYQVTHLKIDFIGNRGGNSRFLSAEFQKADNVCNIDLNDSTEIEIQAGTTKTVMWVKKKYFLNGDTIIVKGDISELKQYINTNKLLVRNGKLFFHLTQDQQYDTSYAAKVWWNNINLGKL